MRIKTKIVALAFFAILLSVGLMGASMYMYVNPILSRQTVRDNQEIVEKATQQLSFALDDTVTYAKGIIVNDQLQELLKRTRTDSGYDYFQAVSRIGTLLKEYSFLRDNIVVDMSIVDPNGKALELNGVSYSDLSQAWFDEFRGNRTYNGMSGPHWAVAPSNTSRLHVITYVTNIYDKQNPSGNIYLGKLLINLDYDALIKPLVTNPSLGIQIAVFDKLARPIFSPDNQALTVPRGIPERADQTPSVTIRQGRYEIVDRIPSIGWVVIGTIPKSKINANLKYFNYAMVYIVLICLAVMWLLIYPVAAGVTKPLLKLVLAMRRVAKGEFQTAIVVRSGDEIEEVSQVFNRMVRDIKQLMDESVMREKKERELELKMFMLQINPHFIWNTLNTVIFLARKAGAPEIVELTKAFISFLQTTIRNHPKMLSDIRDEMKYIDDYCLILKYRYGDAVEIDWRVDEECKAYQMPKMILYPLVENSIFHGILPALRKGRVLITITADEELLHVCVEDNGAGINGTELRKLREQLASPELEDNPDHIGLVNANNRLRLLYGDRSAFRIESLVGEGTRISFSIPLIRSTSEP
jgi:sensor histidine kinase YesM